MKGLLAIILLLLTTTLTFSQAEDSTVVYEEYDTSITYYDSTYTSYDSENSSFTYTQKPSELTTTKKESSRKYTEKKFSKTEWKRIVGETNYTEDPIKEKEKKDKDKPYRGSSMAWNPVILKIIGYILILLLIGAVIYFLLKNALLDGSIKNSIQGDSLLYENQHLDEVSESDIERLLREAIARNDLRAAVRLYYIKLLKHLHSTGYIIWKKDKTNHDYAAELSAFSFTRDFRRLMIAYEIIWYGERTPSAEEFNTLQVNFNDLQRQATRTA